MDVLSHKLLSNDTTIVDKIKPSNCDIYDIGVGNTHYTVQQIAKIAHNSVSSTAQAAQEFKPALKVGVQHLATELADWMYNNFQYLGDKHYEDLRWPECAVASRHNGIDCKSFTILASSILLNLDVPHWIREVRYPGDEPEDFSHVYVIVKDNGQTYAIDGTTSNREEYPTIEEKDVYMSLRHRGLKAPASVSRAARMMRNGSTKGVRSIGAKKLSKWRYKGLGNPINPTTISGFLKFLEILLTLGVSKDVVNTINNTALLMSEAGRFPIVKIVGNTVYLDNIAILAQPSKEGLRGLRNYGTGLSSSNVSLDGLNFDNPFSHSGIGLPISGGATAPVAGSGGFDLGSIFGNTGAGGFDFGSLLSGGGSGSSLGSLAGGVGGALVGGPIGAQLGSTLGGILEGSLTGGTGACGIVFENERNVGHPHFYGSKITLKWRDAQMVLNHFGSSLESHDWGTNHCPSSPAQGKFKRAENEFFEYIAQYLDAVVRGEAQFSDSFEDDVVIMDYLKKVIAAVQSQNPNPNTSNNNQHNDTTTDINQTDDPKEVNNASIGWKPILVGLGIAAGVTAGANYLSKSKK